MPENERRNDAGMRARRRPLRGFKSGEPSSAVQLVADESVPTGARARAFEQLEHVVRRSPRPVLHARITLRRHCDPANPKPAVAAFGLDLGGCSVRARVAATDMVEAVDLAAERLRRNLERLEERLRADRHESGVAVPGEWRHGDLTARRS